MKKAALILLLPGFVLILFSCASLSATLDNLKDGFDVSDIDSQDVEKIAETAREVAKSFEDITPEQEYYIGRAVGAVILDQYEPYDVDRVNDYLNLLGQTLAMASDRPELFSGYHFLVLDSDEINAFATPSGLIFITRGMLKLTRNEDMLAAVLAHEIGHIVNKHGLKAIKQSRITSALGKIAVTAGETLGGEELASLTADFKDSIGDITGTLITSGYSRANEYDADRQAVKILSRFGYDPGALIDLLEEMDKQLVPGGKDFAKTHPDPQKRINAVSRYVERQDISPNTETRQKRYETHLSGI